MAKSFRQIIKGLLLRGETSDPSDNLAGSFWHNSTSGRLKGYLESAIRTIVSEDQTQTLSNKTLDNTNAATIKDSNLTIQDNSDVTKQMKFEASGISAGQTRTFTMPDASTTLVGNDTTQTLSNKTLDNSTSVTIKDTNLTIQDDADITKQAKFQASSITAGQTRTLTIPDASTTLVGTDVVQTLTNKTLSGNTATSLISGSGTLVLNTLGTATVPNATDTLVGKATTDTLSNKTLDNSTIETIKDANFTIQDDSDITKQMKFQLSGITAGQTRTLTTPDASTTIVGTDVAQTLSSKTLDNTTVLTVKDANLVIQDDADTSKQLKFQASGISASTTRTLTAPDANTTIVGTDATQTLSNKTFSDAPILAEIATPSTPSSGFGKIYFKSDGFLYQLNDDGTESKVGSGSGGINYITNSDLESNVTGYSAYADAAGTEPVNGTGGSPTVTATRSTSSPLRGIASLLLTKDAANRQGEGISYDFTIATADQGKVLQGSFDYAISSGTYADDDVRIFVYDVTNSTLIYTTPYLLKNHTLASDKYAFEFQTSSSSTSYRLIFHVASTSASAYTLKFDNISVGPQAKLYGSPISDWIAYTPTLSTGARNGSPTYDKSYWRRVGSDMEIVWDYKHTSAGTTGSGNYLFTIPSGYTIDTTKSGTGSGSGGGATVCGVFNHTYDSNQGSGVCIIASTTQLAAYTDLDANSSAVMWSSGGTGVFGATNLSFSIRAKIPITGWASTISMSSDADTRVILFQANGNPASATSGNPVIVPTTQLDTHNAYNASTGRYTCPVAGYYEVAFQGQTAGAAGTISIYKNAVSYATICIQASSSDHYGGSGYVLCNGGDIIDIRPNTTIDFVGINYTIKRLSGPAQIAASETIIARASGDPAIVTSGNIIVVPTTAFDTHGAYNSSTGRFTCPISGYYDVYGSTASDAVTHTLYVYKNGSQEVQAGIMNSADASLTFYATVKCIAGDILDIRPNATVNYNNSIIHFKRIGI